MDLLYDTVDRGCDRRVGRVHRGTTDAASLPLTDFGSVTFNTCNVTGSDGISTPIWDHSNLAVDMTSNDGTKKASVSALSNNERSSPSHGYIRKPFPDPQPAGDPAGRRRGSAFAPSGQRMRGLGENAVRSFDLTTRRFYAGRILPARPEKCAARAVRYRREARHTSRVAPSGVASLAAWTMTRPHRFAILKSMLALSHVSTDPGVARATGRNTDRGRRELRPARPFSHPASTGSLCSSKLERAGATFVAQAACLERVRRAPGERACELLTDRVHLYEEIGWCDNFGLTGGGWLTVRDCRTGDVRAMCELELALSEPVRRAPILAVTR